MEQKIDPATAFILQILFVVTFILLLSPNYEKQMDIIITAVGTLFLVVGSFGLSVYYFAKKWYSKLPFFFIVTSCMLLVYFILACIEIPHYLYHRFTER
ncbi:hypothetical protein AB1283_18340 [Bacillus sp. S13(2024)]|uniref:hypothetical protein n=1 Tax=unclassified Bacillus (in: firmicutes) TaxID=185979 RepID=UPI003D215546